MTSFATDTPRQIASVINNKHDTDDDMASQVGHHGNGSRWMLGIALLAFLALGVYYNYSLPMFEGYDEISHYRLIDHYTHELALPDLVHAPSHEAHQPPVYYLIGAVLVSAIDRSDVWDVFQVDPHAGLNRRQNAMPTDKTLIPHGTTLAVRILRLFSTVLGLVTVLLTYKLLRLLWPGTLLGVLAVWLMAFNPKFIYLSSIVSNDIAVACVASLVLVVTAQLMTRGKHPNWLQVLALGGLVGLATLCKLSGLATVVPAGFGLLFAEWRNSEISNTSDIRGVKKTSIWRRWMADGALLFIGFALVAGWFFVAQTLRYGHPLAWQQVNSLNIFAQRQEPLTMAQILNSYAFLLPTFWRFSTMAPGQTLVDATLVIASVGASVSLVVGLTAGRVSPRLGLVLVMLAASAMALVPWVRNYGGTEDARLLSPAFGSATIVFVVGILVWLGKRARRALSVIFMTASAVSATLVPGLIIAPAFPTLPPLPPQARVSQVSPAELLALPPFDHAQFDNGMELVGAVVSQPRVRAGDVADVSLYWRVNRAVMQPYAMTIEAFTPRGVSMGKRMTVPLNGMRSTQVWQVGDIYRDEQTIEITSSTSNNAELVTLYVGLQSTLDHPAPVAIVNSSAISAPVGRLKIIPRHPSPQRPIVLTRATFSDGIALEGYTLDEETQTLVVYWFGLNRPAKDYNVFVHMLDSTGAIIAQADGPPPLPTSWWDAQEKVLDVRRLGALNKAQSIVIGLYDPNTNIRLSAVQPDSRPWPDAAVVLWQRPSH